MKKALLVASMTMLAFAGATYAAGNAEAGKTKSAVCAACHGADGNSGANPVWPKLAGQHPNYIIQQLNDFKSEKRTEAMMAPMVAPLSEEDIADLAAYFSSQKRTVGEAAADQVAAGEKLYRAGNATSGVSACTACHGPTGSGNLLSNFPSLSGQGAAYVVKALKDFRSGTRNNDTAGMMQDVASRLTDAEIDAVAQYVQGLH